MLPRVVFILADINTDLGQNIPRQDMSPPTVQVNVRTYQQLNMRSIFHFTCYGDSNDPPKLLMVDGKVNKYIQHVCKEAKVRIAFWNSLGWFEIHAVTKEPFKYEVRLRLKNGPLAMDILAPFFAVHNLTPIYQDNAEHVGGFSEETQDFPPSVGQVSSSILG